MERPGEPLEFCGDQENERPVELFRSPPATRSAPADLLVCMHQVVNALRTAAAPLRKRQRCHGAGMSAVDVVQSERHGSNPLMLWALRSDRHPAGVVSVRITTREGNTC